MYTDTFHCARVILGSYPETAGCSDSGDLESSTDGNGMQALSGRTTIGAGIVLAYLVATLLIGWISRRRSAGANDFLNATRSQPFWIVTAAFFAANCGALEIIGLSAVAAQYGVQAFHFYWIGAIPGMIFLSAVMMPIYMRAGVRSLPEYLERRYSARLRWMNAWLILVTVLVVAGTSVYAMAQVLQIVFGWPFTAGIWLVAAVVLVYVLLGGLRATIYNEVFQLVVIVLGLAPLALHIFLSTPRPAMQTGSYWHLWTGLPVFSPAAQLDGFGVVIGLGFVLSLNYWCTDFVQIQRALTSRTIEDGRMVPLAAGFGKLGFSMLVVFPALGVAALLGPKMPAMYDQTLPALMRATYGPILLGLGITALVASLMSGLAANVSAFASLWTEEIYRTSLRVGASEAHYIRVGRVAIFVAVLLSIAASYLAFCFRDLMELVQMIFSLLGAPFLAVLLMGFFTRRATTTGAAAGIVCGVLAAASLHILIALHLLAYGSQMSANFSVAVYAIAASFAAILLCSRREERKSARQLDGLVCDARAIRESLPASPAWWLLASALLIACIALNYFWR
jgi:SSS family solute:Na+ symporter